MFSKSDSASSASQENKPLIFSTVAIKSAPNPFLFQDGRITGYNFLKENEWLVRTSSVLGALTVDYCQDNQYNSMRFLLTKEGWVYDDFKTVREINTEPNTALNFKNQLLALLDSVALLEGKTQVLPTADLAAKEQIYNVYCARVPHIKAIIPESYSAGNKM